MIKLPVFVNVMDRILNEGLVVLTPEETRPLGERNFEGELIRLEENNGESLTGRSFFARGMHDLGAGYVQITLQAFMEDTNPETGKPERMPLAGDYANEKCTLPASTADMIERGEAVAFDFAVKGEKPIWLYRGVKWIAEFSLSHLFFGPGACKEIKDGKPGVPDVILLKVQGQGGETVYRYGNGGVVGQKG
jgi:hypothetical protein